MHPRYVVLNKELGQTPLQAIEAWKSAHPEYASLPASYAGRLDPMAEGLLLVLLGDECKRQDTYRDLDKEYEIEVLLDIATDTGDVLGMPIYTSKNTSVSGETLSRTLRTQSGTHVVPYPVFSSKTVFGKPLFLHALEGTLDSIQIPTHTETVYHITLLGTEHINKTALASRVTFMTLRAPRTDEPSKALGADFRQDAIRTAWDGLLAKVPGREFLILRLRVVCGSGTYMRTLAERIGTTLGTRAFALSIRRTRIGRYVRFLRFWRKNFR